MKLCISCQQEKPLGAYWDHPQMPDGLQRMCKLCMEARRIAETARKQAIDDKFLDNYAVQNMLWKQARRRAEELGVKFTIKREDIEVVHECPILKLKLTRHSTKFGKDSFSLDRVDATKGYEPGNVRVISWHANYMKSNLTIDDVRRLLSYMEKDDALCVD